MKKAKIVEGVKNKMETGLGGQYHYVTILFNTKGPELEMLTDVSRELAEDIVKMVAVKIEKGETQSGVQ